MNNITTTRKQAIAITLSLIIGLTAFALGINGANAQVSEAQNRVIVSVNR